MVANRVDHATRDLAPEHPVGPVVEQVIAELQTSFQFAGCRVTQRQLLRIQQALVDYVSGARA
jgi:hypothetical protein